MTSSREQDTDLFFNVITGPHHGVLLNEHSDDMTLSLSQFSHADITDTDASIVYEYRSDSSHIEDSVVLMVCSAVHCLHPSLSIQSV